MASRLRMPALAFAGLSIVLSVAVIGCAGRTLQLFNSQQSSNPWLLPIWPNHFDLRGLEALIGTSAGVVLLNLVVVVALFVPALPASFLILVSSLLSTALSLIAIIFPTLLNNKAPRRDTLQTWTCQWSNASTFSGQQPPAQFGTICQQTRFAFFTTLPIFIVQLLLVATATYSLFASRRIATSRSSSDNNNIGFEKGELELGQYNRQSSFDTKRGSPKSTVTESARILPVKGQA